MELRNGYATGLSPDNSNTWVVYTPCTWGRNFKVLLVTRKYVDGKVRIKAFLSMNALNECLYPDY